MAWVLVFFAGLITGVLVLLYMVATYTGGKSKSPPVPASKGEKSSLAVETNHDQQEHVDSAQGESKDVSVDSVGELASEKEVQDGVEVFKESAKKGFECIFSASPDVVSQHRQPLQMSDVHPEVMRIVVNSISSLKDFAATYEVYKALDNPDISMSKVSKIVVTDPILSGKILEVANSAYFGFRKKVDSIGHAIVILGVNNLKSILYHKGLFNIMDITSSVTDYTVEALWEHAAITSICTSHISDLFDGLSKGTLFTIGLLHDIGKFIIANLPPIKSADGDFTEPFPCESSMYNEDEVFGINHALIGRMIIEQWDLSELMGKAVEMHHHLSFIERDSIELEEEYLEYLVALFLGNQIAKLFADEEHSIFPVMPLAYSYHALVDRKKLENIFLDSSLFSEIRKAKALMQHYL